jgi:peptidoglycan/LPS O-acetylase OafA/YrhL
VGVSVQAASALDTSRFAKVVEYFSFQRRPDQLPELDGLRGLAVILVLMRHAVRPFWPGDNPVVNFFGWDFGTFMSNGWIGVDLFFVLSGFLITHHILRLNERKHGNWTWRPYLEKRALRIIPAYYAVLLLAVLGVFPYYEFSSQLLGLRVGYHMLFLQDYLPSNIVVAFWSLGVEEKFYLIAPFLILARANRQSIREQTTGIFMLLLLGIALRIFTAFTQPGVETYVQFFYTFRSPFHMTMDPILLGVLIALIYRSKDRLPRITSKSSANLAFWSGAALFLWLSTASSMMSEISWWDKTLQPTVIALAFAGITFGLIFGGGPAAIFRSTLLFFFARISYSLYLIHIPLVPVSLRLANEIASGENVFSVFIVIFGSLSLLAALALHFAVEKPFLLMKERVS